MDPADSPSVSPAACAGDSSNPASEGTQPSDPKATPTQAGEDSGGAKGASIPAPGNDSAGESQAKVAEVSPRRCGFRAFLLWRRAKKTRLWGSFTGQPLVQGELSLDAVRVVRNDLSESDLEVVQARPAQGPGTKKKPDGEIASAALVAEPAYSATDTRMLGAGKM